MAAIVENYQKVEENDDEEGQKRVEPAAEQLRAPSHHNDGVVGEGNYGGNQEDHEVADDFEAGA